MIYKFSEASRNALENAEKIAIELGHNYIGTEHILYGLVAEEKGLAYKVLSKQRVQANLVLDKIKDILGMVPHLIKAFPEEALKAQERCKVNPKIKLKKQA